MIRVRCYLDGLNFYYGICRKYEIKWIDLEKLFQTLLCRMAGEEVVIEKLFLFTSTVSGPASARQEIYFSALKQHSPRIKIVKGFFKEKQVRGPITVRLWGWRKIIFRWPIITVLTREEKRTDVNLACRIVDDAHIWDKEEIQSKPHQYDITCLISNDSDLSSALEIKRSMKQRIYLISPIPDRPNAESKVARSLRKILYRKFRAPYIKREDVEACLLPPKVGKFYPPDAKGWRI